MGWSFKDELGWWYNDDTQEIRPREDPPAEFVKSPEQLASEENEAFTNAWNNAPGSASDKFSAMAHAGFGIHNTLTWMQRTGRMNEQVWSELQKNGDVVAYQQHLATSTPWAQRLFQNVAEWAPIVGMGLGAYAAAGAGGAAAAGEGAAGAGAAEGGAAGGAAEGAAAGGSTAAAAEGAGGTSAAYDGIAYGGGGDAGAGLTGAEGAGAPTQAYSGGLNANVTGSPGFTGTAGGSPGLSATGATGGGALAPGYFAGETAYPVIGGAAASAGATGLGSTSSGALTQAGGGAAAGTALSRILDGTASTADYLSLLGTGAATGLGIYGANQQAKSLEQLTAQYMAMGAPSRARYETSFLPGFSMANEPGYQDALDQTTKSFLHKASIAGNPADSPNAWTQTLRDVNAGFAYPALQDYRRMNANAGGLSRFADAAPGVATGAIGAQKGVYDAVGYGLGNVFNPPTTLEQLLKQMRTT